MYIEFESNIATKVVINTILGGGKQRKKEDDRDYNSISSGNSEEYYSSSRRSEDDLSSKRECEAVEGDCSPPRRRKRQDDLSPLRDKRKSSTFTSKTTGEDFSPPRRSNKSDISPPRRNQTEKDLSPPRARQTRDDYSSKSKKSDDRSPARRSKSTTSNSTSWKNRSEADSSPPRRGEKIEDPSPRRQNKRNSEKGSTSPKERRESRDLVSSKQSRWDNDTEKPLKMKKTLDGKTAGLQNAKELVLETNKFRKQENELFKSMSAEVSGMNAPTVRRDRKTGKVRNLEEEAEEQKKIQEKEAENKEKYSKWGKGLKQVDDQNEKLAQELHEMSKPFARYADDEDLERYLKEQEREGDPMLAYIRKKKKKDAVESGKPGMYVQKRLYLISRLTIVIVHNCYSPLKLTLAGCYY